MAAWHAGWPRGFSKITYGGTKRYSGWYRELFYKNIFETGGSPGGNLDFFGSDKWDPLVVDVQTDPNPPGAVLHEACGHVNLLLIAIDSPSGACAYTGPVLSHYEFYSEGLTRKTDSDWKQELRQRTDFFPVPPERTRSCLVPGTPKLPPGVR